MHIEMCMLLWTADVTAAHEPLLCGIPALCDTVHSNIAEADPVAAFAGHRRHIVRDFAESPEAIWAAAPVQAVPPGVQPRPSVPYISCPVSVTASVSSSLMKPRRGWCMVVSTDSTMPGSSARAASTPS